MATDRSTVDALLARLAAAGPVRARAMFGEYALYCEDKVVGLICDNRLFVKPTTAAGPYAADCQPAPPYPGAKNYFRVSEAKVDDTPWLAAFVRDTAAALPAPKPGKKK